MSFSAILYKKIVLNGVGKYAFVAILLQSRFGNENRSEEGVQIEFGLGSRRS